MEDRLSEEVSHRPAVTVGVLAHVLDGDDLDGGPWPEPTGYEVRVLTRVRDVDPWLSRALIPDAFGGISESVCVWPKFFEPLIGPSDYAGICLGRSHSIPRFPHVFAHLANDTW
jgi:hypothetical protein